jgi:hypothetical protein
MVAITDCGEATGVLMARVIKLIWRLDYTASFAFFDKPGSALRLLNHTVEEFWNIVGDGANRSLYAQHQDAERFRTFSVEPVGMNGTMEWLSGIELNRVFRDDAFRGVDRIAKELMKLCEIKLLLRAGLRMFCVENFADGRKDALRRVSGLLGENFYRQAALRLGLVNDLGLVLEGEAEDKVRYRAMFGPYARKNVEQALQRKPTIEQYEALDGFDLYFDIDLYETNISFVEHSVYRWAETKVHKAEEFIRLCADPSGMLKRA